MSEWTSSSGLGLISAVGLLPLICGLWVLDPLLTLLGVVLTVIPKVWFVDGMVWLFEDMKDMDAVHQAWVR